MFSVRVMVRARVTLRVELMVTGGFRIRGRVKTRTAGLTVHTGMHTIVVQQPCLPWLTVPHLVVLMYSDALMCLMHSGALMCLMVLMHSDALMS